MRLIAWSAGADKKLEGGKPPDGSTRLSGTSLKLNATGARKGSEGDDDFGPVKRYCSLDKTLFIISSASEVSGTLEMCDDESTRQKSATRQLGGTCQ